MKKLAIFLMLLPVTFSITTMGTYNEKYLLVAENYVGKIPHDLSQPALIQNIYAVSLVPSIMIDDSPVNFVMNVPEGTFDASKGSYQIEYGETVSDYEITEKVIIEEKYITVDFKVRNAGISRVRLDVRFTVSGEGDKSVSMFSPENYNGRPANYFVYLRPELNGQALAVIASENIRPSFEDIGTATTYPIYFGVENFEAGQTFSVHIKFYPFSIRQEGVLDYPIDLYSFMNEPLIKTSGPAPSNIISGNLDEKINEILNIVATTRKGAGEFTDLHDVAFDGTNFDSLDTSIYFKYLCIANDVPCRVVIGEKEGAFYAWVRAYDGNWLDIDTFAGAMEPPAYSIVYLEPKTEFHSMPFSEDKVKAVFEGTSWIASLGQIGFLFYFIIIIVAAAAVVVIFQFKKVILSKLLMKKGVISEAAIEVDGKYKILSEEIDDQFLKEILKRIKDKDGIVNLDQLVETMHFSRELIQDGIVYLIDQKFIEKVV